MLNIITKLFDVIFPPRETELLVRALTRDTVRRLYTPGTKDNITYLSHFKHPAIHALITENKYYNSRKARDLLAVLMEEHFKNSTSTTLIPIPLHPKRERERGYNQVTVVLEQANLPIAGKLLSRIKHTVSQTTLQKTERRNNVKDAFLADENACREITSRHIVLVDDVLTTGATLQAARAKLAPHLPPNTTLSCITLAH